MMSSQGLEALASMEYPGRVIIVGLDPAGENQLIAYVITGRSLSSHARELVYDGREAVKTRVTHPVQLSRGNRQLLIYNCIRKFPGGLAVSNGVQTDLIAQKAEELRTMAFNSAPATILRRALDESRFVEGIDITSYEPDGPAYTPRISGCVTDGAALSIVRRGDDGSAVKHYFPVLLEAGHGKLIATYAGENIDPLPSFGDEPIDVQIKAQKAEELAEVVYRALAPRDPLKDFRVGVAVAHYQPSADRMNISIINSHIGDR